jgi:ferredoxin-NADP reductase
MERAAILGRLSWLVAEVVEIVAETPRVASIVLDVPGWPGHQAGQHVDIRLTAEDGYQAQRSYSIASAVDRHRLALTVERVEDGEVSPFLVDDLMVGDHFELRPALGGPLQLIGGGSGIVPLMAMIRAGGRHPAIQSRLLYSARTFEDIIYREELEATIGVEVTRTLTRDRPSSWTGLKRRVDRAMLEDVTWPPADNPLTFVCGPTGFVESVAGSLVELGHDPQGVRTERFGPTGGPP